MNYITCSKRLILITLFATSLTNIVLAQTTKPKTAPSQTKSTQNCGCDYYPICNFDVTKSYNGKVYKGIRNLDESIDYYNCDGGIVTKIISSRVPTVVTNNFGEAYTTYVTENSMITLLKTKDAIGTMWITPSKFRYHKDYHTIAAKNIAIQHDGKAYNDILKINVTSKGVISSKEYSEFVFSRMHGEVGREYGKSFFYKDTMYRSSYNYYYDKNIGLVKEENVFDELKLRTINSDKLTQETFKDPLFGILTGIWYSDEKGTQTYIHIYKSGSYNRDWVEYKNDTYGFREKHKKYEGGYWRINGTWIETSTLDNFNEWTKSFEIQKLSDNTFTLKRNTVTFYKSDAKLEND